MNAYVRDLPMSFQPDADMTRTLRDAFGTFATGVTVVTCPSDMGPVAITANSFSSISLEPPLVMWAPSKASRRYPAFSRASHFAVHVLGAEQRDLCDKVVADGFALRDLACTENAQGVPLLEGALSRFECRTHAEHDAGDHTIILGEVERVTLGSGPALAFFGGKFIDLTQP